MTTLRDNSVIPSYLDVVERGQDVGSDDLLTNFVLRLGEVRSINYPGDDLNYSGKQVEYSVEVQHRDGNGMTTSTMYQGVTVNTLFGGVADRAEMTYRADSKTGPDGVGNGSKVLLLCVSGDQQKAVILGGISSATTKATKQGHNLFFEFNGAQFTVNDEGEAQFLHKGPTNADGSIRDQYADYSGALVGFDKRGNITVSGPGGQQFVKLVNQNVNDGSQDASIQMQADKLLKVHVAGQMELSSDGNTFIESNNAGIQMNTPDGVFVNSATDSWMKGTTYRLAEGAMNQTLSKSFTAAASLLATASATLMAAAGLNAIPMVGGILAMPAFIALAGQLAGLGGLMGTMGGAIDAMESQADKYLSKNKTD